MQRPRYCSAGSKLLRLRRIKARLPFAQTAISRSRNEKTFKKTSCGLLAKWYCLVPLTETRVSTRWARNDLRGSSIPSSFRSQLRLSSWKLSHTFAIALLKQLLLVLGLCQCLKNRLLHDAYKTTLDNNERLSWLCLAVHQDIEQGKTLVHLCSEAQELYLKPNPKLCPRHILIKHACWGACTCLSQQRDLAPCYGTYEACFILCCANGFLATDKPKRS